MKQRLQALMKKINALSLRERLMVFAALLTVLVAFVNFAALQPMEVRQKRLSNQLKQDQLQITALSDEIAAKLRVSSIDPDAQVGQRLTEVRLELQRLQGNLREQQKGLVTADKMGALLQTLLKTHANVQLRSLKTLPVVSLQARPGGGMQALTGNASENAGTADKDASKENKPAGPMAQESSLKEKGQNPKATPEPDSAVAALADLGRTPAKPVAASANLAADAALSGSQLYRHEVEMVLVGNYLDLLAFLQALEKSPWQLYWGKASLRTETYPQASLSLRVYTLSLDQKWLDL